MLAAETLDGLGVHDEERQILWRALRERAQSEQSYGAQSLPEMAIDPEVMALLDLGFGSAGLGSEADD